MGLLTRYEERFTVGIKVALFLSHTLICLSTKTGFFIR